MSKSQTKSKKANDVMPAEDLMLLLHNIDLLHKSVQKNNINSTSETDEYNNNFDTDELSEINNHISISEVQSSVLLSSDKKQNKSNKKTKQKKTVAGLCGASEQTLHRCPQALLEDMMQASYPPTTVGNNDSYINHHFQANTNANTPVYSSSQYIDEQNNIEKENMDYAEDITPTFKNNILSYIKIDDIIKEKFEEIKKLKDTKKLYEDEILNYLNIINQTSINYGEIILRKNEYTSKGSLKNEYIKEVIGNEIKDPIKLEKMLENLENKKIEAAKKRLGLKRTKRSTSDK